MPINVFVSYSHQDRDWLSTESPRNLIPFFQKYFESKEVHFWYDHALSTHHPSGEYEEIIKRKIIESDYAMVLLSTNLISSEFIRRVEIKLIRELSETRNLHVIPILLSSVNLNHYESFSWLMQRQILPSEMIPLTRYVHKIDEWESIKTDLVESLWNTFFSEDPLMKPSKPREVFSEPSETDESEEDVGTLKNPFLNRGAIRDPDLFIGREQLVSKIFERILADKPQSVSVYGESRIGKSSLLRYINNPDVQKRFIKNRRKYLFAYIDFLEDCNTNPKGFVKSILDSLNPKNVKHVNLLNEQTCYTEFKNFVSRCTEEKIKIILLFDEFEQITVNSTFDEVFYSTLRSLATHYDLAYIVSTFSDLTELCHSKKIKHERFSTVFTGYQLGPFTRGESEFLIEHYLTISNAHFSFKDFYQEIFQETGYLPLFIQIYCSILFDRKMNAEINYPVGISDEYMESTECFFKYIWLTLSEMERKLLINIILEREPSIKDTNLIKRLVAKGYLLKVDQKHRIFSDSFRSFIQFTDEMIEEIERT